MGNRTFLYVSQVPMRNQKDPDPGISACRIDEETGKLVVLGQYPLHGITNVACADPDKGLLYFTGEEPDVHKKRLQGDRVVIMRADRETGLLTEVVQTVPTLSPNPVYVTLDQTKTHMIVANHTTHNAVFKVEKIETGQWRTRAVYDDSTVVLYSLYEDGTVRSVEDVVAQEGSGPLRTQAHAHPHSVAVSPSGKLLAVPDKGADKVFVYTIESNRLKLLAEPWSSQPGDEPRFCAFHPTLRYLYVNHEGNLGLDVLQYSEDGTLTHVQTVHAEPEKLIRQPGQIYEHQGIVMHPSGNWLYSVARGVDAMAVFRIDQDTGRLKLIQLKQMDGQWPRCCQMAPDGNWLVAGTRDSGDLILYRIEEDGRLTESDRIKLSCGVAYVTALQF